MPQTPHIEHHFTASEAVRDVVIGISDGRTVPFALAPGLSGAATASGGAYAVGGLLPLGPCIALKDVPSALSISIGVTLAALAVFGYIKARFTGSRPWKSAFQTTLIGGAAAAAAFAIARAVA